ncbi:mRNA capping enzyme, alpha subunit [Tothia fuscella]|uniref:mRNA-capping enzyme subunit alpha n=1 Tax=Tothia fuscella TaxID=1048955 RepID=A0A9P4TWG5_9PEZI|nr:mRNA capping enzyme, alpha subunit [Tothia fuscella]
MPGSVPQIPGHKASEELAHTFRTEVAHLLERNSTNFPGAQPVSFARGHLRELCRRDYFLCEKTDGIRCLLYCTNEGPREIHYLIDRKNDYYFLEDRGQILHFPMPDDPSYESFHKDTIIDGELVLDTDKNGNETLRYLVFDCLVLDGENLTKKPLDKRIGRFRQFVYKPFSEVYKKYPGEREALPFDVQFKDMDKPYALEAMFKDKLPNLPHGNDGLVFTCKGTEYVTGTDEHILKWKPAHENSIDFKLTLGDFPLAHDESGPYPDYDAKPTITLSVFHGSNRYEPFTPLTFTGSDWVAMKSLNQQLDGRIIECYRDNEMNWRFKKEEDGTPRFRDDKATANHISTVMKVIESIDDGVTMEELIGAEGSIKAAWKARHPEEMQQGPPQQQQGQRPVVNGHVNGR